MAAFVEKFFWYSAAAGRAAAAAGNVALVAVPCCLMLLLLLLLLAAKCYRWDVLLVGGNVLLLPVAIRWSYCCCSWLLNFDAAAAALCC